MTPGVKISLWLMGNTDCWLGRLCSRWTLRVWIQIPKMVCLVWLYIWCSNACITLKYYPCRDYLRARTYTHTHTHTHMQASLHPIHRERVWNVECPTQGQSDVRGVNLPKAEESHQILNPGFLAVRNLATWIGRGNAPTCIRASVLSRLRARDEREASEVGAGATFLRGIDDAYAWTGGAWISWPCYRTKSSTDAFGIPYTRLYAYALHAEMLCGNAYDTDLLEVKLPATEVNRQDVTALYCYKGVPSHIYPSLHVEIICNSIPLDTRRYPPVPPTYPWLIRRTCRHRKCPGLPLAFPRYQPAPMDSHTH